MCLESLRVDSTHISKTLSFCSGPSAALLLQIQLICWANVLQSLPVCLKTRGVNLVWSGTGDGNDVSMQQDCVCVCVFAHVRGGGGCPALWLWVGDPAPSQAIYPDLQPWWRLSPKAALISWVYSALSSNTYTKTAINTSATKLVVSVPNINPASLILCSFFDTETEIIRCGYKV